MLNLRKAAQRAALQLRARAAGPGQTTSVRCSARPFSDKPEDAEAESMLGRLIKGLTGEGATEEVVSKNEPAARSLVPSTPEARFREVLAVPVNRRPLFPGSIFPVQVKNRKLVQELMQFRRDGGQAYVGAFLKAKDEESSSGAEEGAADAAPASAQGAQEGVTVEEPESSDEADASSSADPLEGLAEVGSFAQVHHIQPSEGGAMLLLLGHRRLRRTKLVSKDPLKVAVEHLKDQPYDASEDVIKATAMELVSTLKELLTLHPLYNEQLKSFASFGADFQDMSRLADLAASLTSAQEGPLQEVLEQLNVPERANAVLLLLKKEVELCKLQVDIGKRVEEKISKDQRRYFLQEQLKSIKKELGLEKDDKSALLQSFRDKMEPFKDAVPEDAARVIEEELSKLSSLEPASSEFNVTRNYLDWLTCIPWGHYSPERLDIEHAKQVLDEDHYGLEDVKERILEFIAVGRLRGSTHGKILCLVGPPGVGKTSIGRSIASTLDRKYFRFSVGGLSDVAEIKGHRRTYVGAMPGKMVQCLKSTQTSNPLVLIDEVDKLGRGYQGDPASALLELLDPEQNGSFVDHYLDVPIDLSKVLFMCTANSLDTIPGPLLDRMEIIRLSGYIADEKVNIGRKYLQPQARKDAGVPPAAIEITDQAMRDLVEEYAREAGVRTLKKSLEKIHRKVALKLVEAGLLGPSTAERLPDNVSEQKAQEERSGVTAESPEESSTSSPSTDADSTSSAESSSMEGKEKEQQQEQHIEFTGDPIVVTEGDLVDYVGPPPFTSDKIYDQTPPGVVMGLAWTSMGGNTLYVEAASIEDGENKGSLKTTGQLGEVMNESALIAYTFARSFLQRLPGRLGRPGFFAENALHVHFPAGAIPKDGPSAGCALVTALLSLALNRAVKPDLAMTGEVSLTGRVLPIGGVKEKLLAARRSGVKTVIFPRTNERDYKELTDNVKEGVEAHFVDTYQDVFNLALGSEADHSSGDYGFTDALVFPKDEQHRPDAATAA